MANWIAIKPNNHIYVYFLRDALEQWGCAEEYKNLDAKVDLLQTFNLEFPQELGPVYLKVFLSDQKIGYMQ